MGTQRSILPSSSDEISHTRNKQTDVPSPGECQRRATTIGLLVDDVLLEIFNFYRMIHSTCPHSDPCLDPCHEWNWRILAHVCRRWRRIIFNSPRRLNIRILCTYGTPVRKNLGIWPAFPIDLQLFSQRCMEPEDEDNAIAALEHRDRVYAVRLFGTGEQLATIAEEAMQEPFPVLTHLCLRSKDQDTPFFTAAFLGGSAPHLQTITLRRILFPSLPILLLSTSDLVTLNLFEIPNPGYISPERMVVCLVALPRLEVLAITYQDAASRPDQIRPPPVTRSVLPALTRFEFQGAFEYLEDFVAQIDSPQLERISIIYPDDSPDFQVTLLSDFIDRSIGPSRFAYVHFHILKVTFTLSREYPNTPGCDHRFVVTTLSHFSPMFRYWYLPDLARVFSRFSAALCTVVHLELDAELEEDAHSDDAYDVDWLHLMRQLPAMRTLYVSPTLVTPVFLALEDSTAEMVAEALPSLGLICLEGAAIRPFVGRPITVVKTRDEFNEKLESYVSR